MGIPTGFNDSDGQGYDDGPQEIVVGKLRFHDDETNNGHRRHRLTWTWYTSDGEQANSPNNVTVCFYNDDGSPGQALEGWKIFITALRDSGLPDDEWQKLRRALSQDDTDRRNRVWNEVLQGKRFISDKDTYKSGGSEWPVRYLKDFIPENEPGGDGHDTRETNNDGEVKEERVLDLGEEIQTHLERNGPTHWEDLVNVMDNKGFNEDRVDDKLEELEQELHVEITNGGTVKPIV